MPAEEVSACHNPNLPTAPSPRGQPETDPASLAVDWDYTRLADSYIHRPDYAGAAIDHLLAIAGPKARRWVIDLGAPARVI